MDGQLFLKETGNKPPTAAFLLPFISSSLFLQKNPNYLKYCISNDLEKSDWHQVKLERGWDVTFFFLPDILSSKTIAQ